MESDKAQTVERGADVEHVGSAASLGLCPLENLGNVGSSDLEFLCRTVGIVEVEAVAGVGHLPRLVRGSTELTSMNTACRTRSPTATGVLPRHSDLPHWVSPVATALPP